MTDDESRKAAWYEWLRSDACVTPYDRNAWDAAWIEATKRGRENIDTEAIAWAYGKLRNFGVLDNTVDNAMMAYRLMAMLQGPKE